MLFLCLLLASLASSLIPAETNEHSLSIKIFDFKKRRKFSVNFRLRTKTFSVLRNELKNCFDSTDDHLEHEKCLQIVFNNDYFWS